MNTKSNTRIERALSTVLSLLRWCNPWYPMSRAQRSMLEDVRATLQEEELASRNVIHDLTIVVGQLIAIEVDVNTAIDAGTVRPLDLTEQIDELRRICDVLDAG